MAIFTNQATLTYNGNVVSSNITTGELLEVLSATKTAVLETYTPNSEITYVINIINSGSTAFSGLTITDDLGQYTFDTIDLVPLDYVNGSIRYYIDGVLQTAPIVTSVSPLTITGITVPTGGDSTIIYVARTNEFAPLDSTGSIKNTAVISGANISDITVTESVTPENAAALSISKSLSPATVTENGQITYTFTIQNTGNVPITTADTVTVTDTFDPILTNLNVSFNGTVWTEPDNYSYSEATGLFQTALGQITVPAATYTQDAATGVWSIAPGVSELVITGIV